MVVISIGIELFFLEGNIDNYSYYLLGNCLVNSVFAITLAIFKS